jgi:signal transduction histidine kinase
MPAPKDRLQAARLHGMAEMARALGHEVNNTLAAIVLRLEMLRDDVPSDSPARESVAVIEEASRQGIALVRRVRGLARLSRPLVPRAVDLADAVHAALAPLRAHLATVPGVNLHTDTRAVPALNGDAGELVLAIRELVVNALDAVGDRGHVRIATGIEAGFVVCRVADDGAGFTPETLAHAFEPFFTTSGERGRGLGLTIALGVAARHDGDVRLAAAPRGGCVATLRVPRCR